ncbi:MAG: hypothetical protein AAGA83_19195 [Cyanobacteria bacterium P01_F01_bin.116]
MSFVNIKHWATLDPSIFPKQYAALGISEPPGLWFRAVGKAAQGGTLVTELWADQLSWRQQRDQEVNRQDMKAAKASHGVSKPSLSFREESTAVFFPTDLGHHLRSQWIELVQPGQVLLMQYPNITVQKYRSGMQKLGLREGDPAAQGLLCAADGPDKGFDWYLLRVWQNNDIHSEVLDNYLKEISKPTKATLHQEGSLEYLYFSRDCPTGSHNAVVPDMFI